MDAGGASWELWRTFDVVMREGSLSAGARALKIAQPTAGRHIAELESVLAAGALFTRSGRGLRPTELALALAPHARSMAMAAAALVRTASAPAEATSGVVRISVSEVVGGEVLPPILAALRREHPGLTFELVLTNASSDLLQRDADVAVRMTRPQQQALVAKAAGRIVLGLYALKSYLASAGPLETVADLASHAVVGFDRDAAALHSIRSAGASSPPFALRCDNQLAQLAAVRAGFGVGVVQAPIAKRQPDFIRVLGGAFEAHLDVWVVMHEDLRSTRRMRVVFDALVEGMLAHAADAQPQGATERPVRRPASQSQSTLF